MTRIQVSEIPDGGDLQAGDELYVVRAGAGRKVEYTPPPDADAEHIKQELESLQLDDRLDASAIKNLPQPAGGGLASVESDGTLAGLGTQGSPLRVAIPFTGQDQAKLAGIEAGAQVNVGEEYTQSEKTKLAGIETGATEDQTPAEIRDALQNLSGSSRLDAQFIKNIPTGVTGDSVRNALEGLTGASRLDASAIQNLPQPGGGGLSSVNTDGTLTGLGTSGSALGVANPFTDADEQKLDGIETGATADQTATEIKTALETLSGSNRLDASAIQNIPSGGTTLTNTQVMARSHTAGVRLRLSGSENLTPDSLGRIFATAANLASGAWWRDNEILHGWIQNEGASFAGLPSGQNFFMLTVKDATNDVHQWAFPDSASFHYERRWNSNANPGNFERVLETLTGTAAPSSSTGGTTGSIYIRTGTNKRIYIRDGSAWTEFQSGIDQSAVDARIDAKVPAVFQAGNTDEIANAKLPLADASHRGAMSAAEKTKLGNIETDATADQSATEIRDALASLTGSDRLDATSIKNLPTGGGGGGGITSVATDATLSGDGTGSDPLSVAHPFTAADRQKLTGIEAMAEVNVQADWNATGGDAQILNKPTIPAAFSGVSTDATISGDGSGTALSVANPFTDADEAKLDAIEAGATTDQTGAEMVTALEALSSGNRLSYTALDDLPTIPSTTGLLSSVSTDATITGDGAGTALSVAVPYSTAEKTKLAGIAAGAQVNVGVEYTQTEKTKLAGVAVGAEVNVQSDWNAVSGDAQILNKPTIPNVSNLLSTVSTGSTITGTGVSGSPLNVANPFTDADEAKLDGIAAGAEVNVRSDWTATSGDAVILNKPTIPSTSGLLSSVSTDATITGDGASNPLSVATPFTAGEKTKLAGVEAGATADQTAAEVRTALSTLTGDDRLDASAIKNIPTGGGSGGTALNREILFERVNTSGNNPSFTGRQVNAFPTAWNLSRALTADDDQKLMIIGIRWANGITDYDSPWGYVQFYASEFRNGTTVTEGASLDTLGSTGFAASMWSVVGNQPWRRGTVVKMGDQSLGLHQVQNTSTYYASALKVWLQPVSGIKGDTGATGPAGPAANVSTDATLTGNGSAGNVLSVANPYSTAEKAKLGGIATGAEVNVQSDWNQTTSTADDFIKNKPTIPSTAGLLSSVTSDATLSGSGTSGSALSVANPFTAAEKTKLSGIAAGAEVNVQSNWNATSGDAAILNKPTIPDVSNFITSVTSDATLTGDGANTALRVANPFTAADETKLDGIETGATADQSGAEIVTSLEALGAGSRLSYNRLDDLPTIPAPFSGVVLQGSTLSGNGTSGSGLRVTNPFSGANRQKLDGIEAGATQDQTAAEIKASLETLQGTARLDASAIQNLPQPGGGGLASVNSNSTLTGLGTSGSPLGVANPFTNADEAKLDSIAAGAEVNVKANWNATSGDAEILNKPTIPDVSGLLSSVSTDSTINGNGTAGSQLSVANPFTAADETKLDGIEASATADQTAAEIKTALETLTGTARLDASAIQNLPSGGGVTPGTALARETLVDIVVTSGNNPSFTGRATDAYPSAYNFSRALTADDDGKLLVIGIKVAQDASDRNGPWDWRVIPAGLFRTAANATGTLSGLPTNSLSWPVWSPVAHDNKWVRGQAFKTGDQSIGFSSIQNTSEFYSAGLKVYLQPVAGVKGDTGPAGAAGAGVPTGGTSGQILAKNSNTDRDTHWIDAPTGGGTGTLDADYVEDELRLLNTAALEDGGVIWSGTFKEATLTRGGRGMELPPFNGNTAGSVDADTTDVPINQLTGRASDGPRAVNAFFWHDDDINLSLGSDGGTGLASHFHSDLRIGLVINGSKVWDAAMSDATASGAGGGDTRFEWTLANDPFPSASGREFRLLFYRASSSRSLKNLYNHEDLTASEIRNALEGLAGENRLPASAIRGLVTGGGEGGGGSGGDIQVTSTLITSVRKRTPPSSVGQNTSFGGWARKASGTSSGSVFVDAIDAPNWQSYDFLKIVFDTSDSDSDTTFDEYASTPLIRPGDFDPYGIYTDGGGRNQGAAEGRDGFFPRTPAPSIDSGDRPQTLMGLVGKVYNEDSTGVDPNKLYVYPVPATSYGYYGRVVNYGAEQNVRFRLYGINLTGGGGSSGHEDNEAEHLDLQQRHDLQQIRSQLTKAGGPLIQRTNILTTAAGSWSINGTDTDVVGVNLISPPDAFGSVTHNGETGTLQVSGSLISDAAQFTGQIVNWSGFFTTDDTLYLAALNATDRANLDGEWKSNLRFFAISDATGEKVFDILASDFTASTSTYFTAAITQGFKAGGRYYTGWYRNADAQTAEVLLNNGRYVLTDHSRQEIRFYKWHGSGTPGGRPVVFAREPELFWEQSGWTGTVATADRWYSLSSLPAQGSGDHLWIMRSPIEFDPATGNMRLSGTKWYRTREDGSDEVNH